MKPRDRVCGRTDGDRKRGCVRDRRARGSVTERTLRMRRRARVRVLAVAAAAAAAIGRVPVGYNGVCVCVRVVTARQQ